MYKVMIVDDEILVRVGLKSTIDWESLGFTVVAEASNGEQAFELFKLHKPDVLLTDIKMPKKDGLWLTETVKKEKPGVKVLMLTCYDDFSYVREALKLGASNYILKSEIEDEELMNIMRDIRISLDEDNKKLEKNFYLQHQINSNLAILKERLLNDLVNSDIKEEELFSRCGEMNFDLREKQFLLAVIYRDDGMRYSSFSDKDWKLMNFAIVNIAAEIFNENNMNFLAASEENRFTILLSAEQIGWKAVLPVFERIRDSVSRYLDIPLSVVASRKFSDIRLAGEMLGACAEKAQFLFYDDAGILQADDKGLAEVNIVKIKKHFEGIFLEFLEEKNIQGAVEELDRLETYFRQNLYIPFEVRMFYSNLSSSALEYYNGCFSGEEGQREYTGHYNLIMKAGRIREITALMKELFTGVIQDMEKCKIKNSNNVIRKAIEYIDKYYAEGISLQSLSEHLNLSRHYVCYLFKKETGENLSHYVNRIRIEKAQQLLLASDYKIKEIYDRLGFSDPQYFCRMFKKITGMTVNQYRDSAMKNTKGA